MANVLVHTSVQGGQPTPASIDAIACARRIATELGATLHVAASLTDEQAPEGLVAAIGRAGADKIELVPRADDGPARWSRTGPALVALCRRVTPRLVLFGAADDLGDIAARLAASIGAGFFPDSHLVGERKEPTLERFVDGRRAAMRYRLFALRGPLVATVAGSGSAAAADGDDDIDVSVAPRGVADDVAWLGQSDDPAPTLARAATVVSIGAAAGAADIALARELAAALDGELAGTVTAARRGLVPAARAVGVGGRRIAPQLYVACASSGSPAHLAGLAPTTAIVALNRDPAAAIFRAARFGMVGELRELLPRLIGSLGASS